MRLERWGKGETAVKVKWIQVRCIPIFFLKSQDLSISCILFGVPLTKI